MHKYAIQYKFNNSTSDVSAVGEHLLVLGQICTANAYETTISYLSSKFWHRLWIRRSWFSRVFWQWGTFTMWPSPFSFWLWTLVICRPLRHNQTLYHILAKSNNPWLSYWGLKYEYNFIGPFLGKAHLSGLVRRDRTVSNKIDATSHRPIYRRPLTNLFWIFRSLSKPDLLNGQI